MVFLFYFVCGILLPLYLQCTAASLIAISSNRRSDTATCTVTDVSELPAAKQYCTTITIGTIQVPAGRTLDLTNLKTGTHVVFDGYVTFGYKQWKGPLIDVSGSNLIVKGTSRSILDGNGARWWDGKGSNGGKIKPKFFFAHDMKSSIISGLSLKDTPVHAFSITDSYNLTLSQITMNNKNGDQLGACNTDAFDVSNSNYVTINDATVYNQDDCLAINSGTNINFLNGYCSGGHGISIGSVGGRSNNIVDTVCVQNSTVVNSDNGIYQCLRIKAIAGATGSITNVLYSGIWLQNVDNAVVIRQDYTNKGYTGQATAGVQIMDVTVYNVVGTVSQYGTAITINCAQGACTNWSWGDVTLVSTDDSASVQNTCTNAPSCVGC